MCFGRVIVPLTHLCGSPVGLRSSPKHTAYFSLAPASRQHSKHAMSDVYTEALRGVPGTGMVRPHTSLGHITLSFEFTFEPRLRYGLLSAMAEDGDRSSSPDDETLADDSEGIEPQIIKRVIQRFERLSGRPYILTGPYICVLFPLLWYGTLFAPLWQLPYLVWMSVLANGAAGYAERTKRGEQFVFYEDMIEPEAVQGLAKLKLLKKAVLALQKVRQFPI